MNSNGACAGKLVVAMATVVMLAGMSARADARPPEENGVSQPVAVQPLTGGTDGEYGRPALVLARNAKEWNDAMDDMQASGGLVVAPARHANELAIDWSQNYAVLVALGQYPTAAYEVNVTAAASQGPQLNLEVTVSDYAPNLAEMTTPYQIVLVPRLGWNVVKAVYLGSAPSDLPASSPVLSSPDMDGAPSQVAATWGTVKNLYR